MANIVRFGTRVPQSIRVFAEKFLLGWVSSLFPIYVINPNHQKSFAVGKSGPNAKFNLIFLGLGWPWVGEFVGFIVILLSLIHI